MSDTKDALVEEVKKTQVKASFLLRGFLDKLIPSIFISAYSLYLLIQWTQTRISGTYKYLPIEHVKMKTLFVLGEHTPIVAVLILALIFILNKLTLGRKNILFFLIAIISTVVAILVFQYNAPISPDLIKYTLFSMSVCSGLYALYYIVYAKTAFVEVNYRILTVKTGVFNRETDTTNNTHIKDIDKSQSFVERILGLETIKFLTKTSKERKIIKYLSQEDADRVFSFLQAYAADTSTEYWMARDRMKNGNQQNRAVPLPRNQMFDDSNQGDDDGEGVEE